MLAINNDPTTTSTWWNGAAPATHDVLIAEQPAIVGNLNGVPAAARDEANRLQLDADLALEAEEAAGTLTGLFLHVLAAIAEFERELIVERTKDGLAASRARGRSGGRKPSLTSAAVRQAQEMYDSKQYTVAQIAAAFKTTRPTIYRALDPRSLGR